VLEQAAIAKTEDVVAGLERVRAGFGSAAGTSAARTEVSGTGRAGG
jgi:hypothetical protein